jgi:hypothetical protein
MAVFTSAFKPFAAYTARALARHRRVADARRDLLRFLEPRRAGWSQPSIGSSNHRPADEQSQFWAERVCSSGFIPVEAHLVKCLAEPTSHLRARTEPQRLACHLRQSRSTVAANRAAHAGRADRAHTERSKPQANEDQSDQ